MTIQSQPGEKVSQAEWDRIFRPTRRKPKGNDRKPKGKD